MAGMSSPARYAAVEARSSSIAAAPAPDAAWYVAAISAMMRLCLCSGHSGITATIATQFGLAMMPICREIASGFTSGTTSGTPGSMRNAEELSTTTAPCRTAIGANRRDTAPPAENSAISTPGKLSSFSSSTAMPSPRNSSLLPAERPDANRRSRSSGKVAAFQAADQFAADRAGGADDGDGGMVQAHDTRSVRWAGERVPGKAKAPSGAGGALGGAMSRLSTRARPGARPKGFQFFIVHLPTRRDMSSSYRSEPAMSNANNGRATGPKEPSI